MNHGSGITRRDYERLPSETKAEVATLFDKLKDELRRRGFSLRFLGHDGRWNDLTAPKFLALSEDHYQRLINGSKWVTSTKRRDLVDRISELYKLAFNIKIEDAGLEAWFT